MLEEKGGEVAQKWQNHAVGRVTVEQVGLPLDHEGQQKELVAPTEQTTSTRVLEAAETVDLRQQGLRAGEKSRGDSRS